MKNTYYVTFADGSHKYIYGYTFVGACAENGIDPQAVDYINLSEYKNCGD